ncbi:MAG: TolC family protein, partial [Gammaproteobacteria bacterium]
MSRSLARSVPALLLALNAVCVLPASAELAPPRVEELEALVLAAEPGALAREARSRALAESAVAARQLPDPELELGIMSIPMGGFSRDVEPMSEIGLGLTQRFPAGQSRRAEGDAIAAESAGEGLEAAARRAFARRELRLSWVEWLYWRDSVALLEERRALLSGLLTARQAAYAGAAGSRAETLALALEGERLGTEITMAEGEARAEWGRLGRWFPQPLQPAADPEWPQWSLRQSGGDAD